MQNFALVIIASKILRFFLHFIKQSLRSSIHLSLSLQTVSISMYFGVSWLDPRLLINTTAPEWKEAKTGPKDVSCLLRPPLHPRLIMYGMK